MEKVALSLQVRTPIFATSPKITAKIGTKEGIKRYDRFTVWENKLDNNDNIIAKKQGTIRANEVVDNTGKNYGESGTTTFCQVGGRKLEKGMVLEHKKDIGFRINAGWGIGQMDGFEARLSYGKRLRVYGLIGYTSVSQHYFHNGNFYLPDTTNILSGKKLIEDTDSEIDAKYNLLRYGLGVHYDFYFLRNFSIGLNAGFARESNLKSSYNGTVIKDGEIIHNGGIEGEMYPGHELDDAFTSFHIYEPFKAKNYITLGVELGINIFYYMQAFAGANYYVGLNFNDDNITKTDIYLKRNL